MTVADDLANTVREALDYLDDAHTWDAKKALDALVAQAVVTHPKGPVADALAREAIASLYRLTDDLPAKRGPEAREYIRRVEAEIARLEENQMVRYERGDDFSHDFWKERAKAAEAEIARLRDGLRFYAEFDDDAIARRARALLADDGAASYCVCGHILGSPQCCNFEDGAAKRPPPWESLEPNLPDGGRGAA